MKGVIKRNNEINEIVMLAKKSQNEEDSFMIIKGD